MAPPTTGWQAAEPKIPFTRALSAETDRVGTGKGISGDFVDLRWSLEDYLRLCSVFDSQSLSISESLLISAPVQSRTPYSPRMERELPGRPPARVRRSAFPWLVEILVLN